MSKIKLEDSAIDMTMKLSEGNPGAVSVLTKIIAEGSAIDPDSWSGSFSPILDLDEYEIYGPKIWLLYKDVCRQCLISMLAVLRACQLGILDPRIMLHAIDNRGEGLDVPDILDKVREQLKNFGNNP